MNRYILCAALAAMLWTGIASAATRIPLGPNGECQGGSATCGDGTTQVSCPATSTVVCSPPEQCFCACSLGPKNSRVGVNLCYRPIYPRSEEGPADSSWLDDANEDLAE